MSRPGGNPDLQVHRYTTERSEPLKAQLNIRVPESMLLSLKDLEAEGIDYREFVRLAIEQSLVAHYQARGVKMSH